MLFRLYGQGPLYCCKIRIRTNSKSRFRDSINDKGATTFCVRRFNGSTGEPPQKVTAEPGDIFLARMGRDKKGCLGRNPLPRFKSTIRIDRRRPPARRGAIHLRLAARPGDMLRAEFA